MESGKAEDRSLTSSHGQDLTMALQFWAQWRYIIVEAAQVAADEVLTANEVWTLRDFWTGNVLVSAPDGHDEPEVTILDLELAKPGIAAFDIGHIGAEMLCPARFRH
jgi:aminoglycoside/choline kinase family phosphotransferase